MTRPLRRGLFVAVAVLATITAIELLPIDGKVFLCLLVVIASLIYGLAEVGWQLIKDAHWLGRWIRKQLRRQQDNSQS